MSLKKRRMRQEKFSSITLQETQTLFNSDVIILLSFMLDEEENSAGRPHLSASLLHQ